MFKDHQHVFVASGPHAGMVARTCGECREAFTSRVHRAATLDDLPLETMETIRRELGTNGVAVLGEHDLVVVQERGGPVAHCIKCYMHQLVREAGWRYVPNYSHQFMHPTRVLRWNMALAHALASRHEVPPAPIQRRWLEHWISYRSNLIAGHIDHIPAEHLDDPVLCDITYVEARTDEGVPCSAPFRLLLDGHHRAARKLRDGVPVYGRVLRPWEHDRVVTVDEGAYDPELMGWLSREQAEALPWVRSTGGLIDEP